MDDYFDPWKVVVPAKGTSRVSRHYNKAWLYIIRRRLLLMVLVNRPYRFEKPWDRDRSERVSKGG